MRQIIPRPVAVVALLALGCARAEDCGNTVLSRLAAPTGDLQAVVFSRDCGATTGFSTQVSVLTEGSTPREAGNVFVADSDHGRAPVDSVGGPIVQVSWRSADTLVVRHHVHARVFRAERLVKGVVVVFVSDSLVPVEPSAAPIGDSIGVGADTLPTRDPTQIADVDCDGIPDSVALTRTDARITLTVFRAAVSSPTVIEIPVAPSQQHAVCRRQARLVFESQESDPTESGGLPGFIPSATCKGMAIEDGDCDALHVYWNHNAKAFSSWRN